MRYYMRHGPSRDVAYSTYGVEAGTEIERFESNGPLFDDPEVAAALASQSEDGVFERLILRGLDE